MIIAIDPGNTHSGVVILDDKYKPVFSKKILNENVLSEIDDFFLDMYAVLCAELIEIDDNDYEAIDKKSKKADSFHPGINHTVVIEQIASYGMSVGKEVFDTAMWSGRFIEIFTRRGFTVEFLPRITVKMNLCKSPRAGDSNIIQALVDRFAPGQKNHGKGTKKSPGWFYGFSADIWQAYALGVTHIDMKNGAIV